MASKNSFSIDDILSQYSSEEQTKNTETNDSAEEETEENIISNPETNDTEAEEHISDNNEENDSDISVSENSEVKDKEESDEPDTTSEEAKFDSTEEDETENRFQNIRHSFSYRSATRIQDRPNKIVRNPEDNIRYVHRENDTVRSSSDIPRQTRKRKTSAAPETKSDISVLDNSSKSKSFTEKSGKLSGRLPDFRKLTNLKKELLKSRSVSEKNHDISLKSIPDVDFFSIDIEINDETEEQKTEGFFKNLNSSFSKTAENNIDDYNTPGDASLIQDDLYDLKNNLTIKFFIQFAALLVSIYLSASVLYNVPIPAFLSHSSSPHTYSFAMFLIAATVLFSSFPVITSGIRNIFRKKADCDSLAAVTITFSAIAAAVSTENASLIQSGSIYIFTPVAISAFLANTIGKHLIVNRAINNFDMLISSYEKHSLVYVENEARAEQMTKGVVNDYPILAASRKTGFAKDFLRYTYSSDIADKLCRKLVPISLIISLFLTLISVFVCSKTMNTLNFSFVLSSFSMFLCSCACFGIPIAVNLPLSSAAAEAEENESILLGYQSIDDFYDTNALMVNAEQIIPDHSIKLCAIKMFSDTKIDDAIVTAASVVRKSGSIFNGLFTKIIDNNDSLLEKVENYSYEDSLGLCGWIKNKRVLFGNRQLMINHNIEGVPPKSKEQDLVGKGRIPIYLSISGNLAAIFIVKLKADRKISEDLSEITNNGVSLIIKSIDSITTVTRISRLYNIPEDMIKIIPVEQHEYCSKITAPVSDESASVICTGTLSSVTKAISNIKYIHHSALTGLVLQSTSAIISVFFVLIFMIIGIMNQITPLMMIFYHTVWLIITLLVMKIKPR